MFKLPVAEYLIVGSDKTAIYIDLYTPAQYCVAELQIERILKIFVVVVALLFYVHDKHLTSCRDGQLT